MPLPPEMSREGVCMDATAIPDRSPLRVQHFPKKGRGVVAAAFIPEDTLVERCPVLIIPHDHRHKTDTSVIFTYVFMWEPNTTEQDLYNGTGRAAIALGLTSLLNHSYSPNLCFIRHFDDLELEIRSIRSIEPGEELTIDYQMKLWFDPS
jgi:uncharacterized protein